jgi:hypothetical protein
MAFSKFFKEKTKGKELSFELCKTILEDFEKTSKFSIPDTLTAKLDVIYINRIRYDDSHPAYSAITNIMNFLNKEENTLLRIILRSLNCELGGSLILKLLGGFEWKSNDVDIFVRRGFIPHLYKVLNLSEDHIVKQSTKTYYKYNVYKFGPRFNIATCLPSTNLHVFDLVRKIQFIETPDACNYLQDFDLDFLKFNVSIKDSGLYTIYEPGFFLAFQDKKSYFFENYECDKFTIQTSIDGDIIVKTRNSTTMEQIVYIIEYLKKHMCKRIDKYRERGFTIELPDHIIINDMLLPTKTLF